MPPEKASGVSLVTHPAGRQAASRVVDQDAGSTAHLDAGRRENRIKHASPQPRGVSAGPAGWNSHAAKLLQTYCYQPDGIPPRKDSMACDLRWFKCKLIRGESPDRIAAALRGVPLLWDLLQTSKWSPAKVFTKRGPWVDLYERAVHAEANFSAKDKQRVRRLGEIMAELIEMSTRRSDTVRRPAPPAAGKLNGMTQRPQSNNSGQRGDAPGPAKRLTGPTQRSSALLSR